MKRRHHFPDPRTASKDGIVAAGGNADPELLKEAYARGIFPWPHEGYPLLWFSPDPRFVLEPQHVHVPRSLKKAMKKTDLVVRADTAFRAVMEGCAEAERPGQGGTWITDDMIEGYGALHREGIAHSLEAWRGDALVGGLYGVSFGTVFFGESMFARVPDASKIVFVTLCVQLVRWGFTLVDCQSRTDHLARFGAEPWRRERFLAHLQTAVGAPTRLGPWHLDITPAAAAQIAISPAT